MSEPIIELHELTKKYGKFTAVDHINLSVQKGEIFGILGPNGAGIHDNSDDARIDGPNFRNCTGLWDQFDPKPDTGTGKGGLPTGRRRIL